MQVSTQTTDTGRSAPHVGFRLGKTFKETLQERDDVEVGPVIICALGLLADSIIQIVLERPMQELPDGGCTEVPDASAGGICQSFHDSIEQGNSLCSLSAEHQQDMLRDAGTWPYM